MKYKCGAVATVPTQKMTHMMVGSGKQKAKNRVVRNGAQSWSDQQVEV